MFLPFSFYESAAESQMRNTGNVKGNLELAGSHLKSWFIKKKSYGPINVMWCERTLPSILLPIKSCRAHMGFSETREGK